MTPPADRYPQVLGNLPNELHAEHGAAPYHYYVTIAAVEPSQQGKGHGSRLLQAIHRIADSEVRTSCFLLILNA